MRVMIKVAVVIGDLNDARVRKTIVETAVNTFGKIDILVNNSGIALFNNVQTLTENDFDKIMNTNLKSTIFLTQLCVPYLIAQQGKRLTDNLNSNNCLYFSF